MSGMIQGVLPVLHTPFLEDETIDRGSLQREIDWCYELGVDGICGAMVSEVLRLTFAERLELTRLMSDISDGRGAVIASVGAESTRQALDFARQAEETGCDAVMAIPPVTTALPVPAVGLFFDARRAMSSAADGAGCFFLCRRGNFYRVLQNDCWISMVRKKFCLNPKLRR